MRLCHPLLASLLLCSTASAQATLLDQPPVNFGNYIASCQGLVSFSVAEDFQVPAGGWNIGEIVFYGAYASTNVPIPDDFTIHFYDGVGQTPNSTPTHTWTNVVPVRTMTTTVGGQTGAVNIYEYRFVLPTPVALSAGTHWLGVNQLGTIPVNQVWSWAAGQLDAVHGISGSANSGSNPASFWNWYGPTYDPAMKLIEAPAPTLAIGLTSPCPGPSTLTIDNGTPGGLVAVTWSPTVGSWSIPGAFCTGTLFGLVNPTVRAQVSMNASGSATIQANLPAIGCGYAYLQALDVVSCEPSNIVAL